MRKILFWVFSIAHITLYSQDYFPKNDGVATPNDNYTAFINATITVSPGKVYENATLLIQKGKVVSAGTSVSIPKNAVIYDLKGKHIYPSLIDPYTSFGIESPNSSPSRGRSPQYDAERSGYYWNDHIRPDTRAADKFSFNAKDAEAYLKAGIGVVGTHHQDAIARGSGMVVALNKEASDNLRVLNAAATQHFSFSKSALSRQSYPTSTMGAMALLRQMYYDADWYEKGQSETKDLALEALLEQKKLPAFFEAKDKLNVLRADAVGDRFGIQYHIVGSGYEFEHLDAIVSSKAKLILPLNFPDAYDVSDPLQADYVSLNDMRRWNQAPANPKLLDQSNVQFAFTTTDLKSPNDVLSKVQKAIEYGLPYEKAIAAFTTIPASMLNTQGIGTLTSGNWANFLISNGPLFTKDTKIYEHWVQGAAHRFSDYNAVDVDGNYTLSFNGKTYNLNIKGSTEKASAQVLKDSLKLNTKFNRKGDWINLQFTDEDQVYRLSHRISESSTNWTGTLSGPKATTYRYQISKQASTEESSEAAETKEQTQPEIMPISYPNKAFGSKQLPSSERILFRNATVWTSENEGVLTNTDVLIQDGKIAAIGKNLSASGARIIDATGKHLTAGIIDEHSHLALSSINESGHNSSAEVITADVINPDDIGIYRALAGGVTSAQLLHGSANPIGGRSAIVKFKWGETADGMKFPDMPKFIKFALGENVKQSNWGSTETIRFPQTRMGVEQVYEDYFSRAKAYAAAKKSKKPYRYDEEMEVIAEIIAGERFISCHSYVQSEINMLMKVAERYGFTVNTFTHILEGYKVADKMREHGVKGASTFSDWWAYKFEVNDAIPYNAAIMHNEGLNVSINSDDSEMIRRLNQEAGKVVKYGSVSEHDAWKMVTINPAKMLHIDKRVGSIKKGKDADLVLWSANPLSVYALAEMTLIEGAIYFDRKRDEQLRKDLAVERSKLIELMLSEKASGAATQSPRRRPNIHVHCDTEDLEAIEHAINH